MTDQDPTQRFESPPTQPSPPPPPSSQGAAAPPPALTPVATLPVSGSMASRPGGSRLKWLVALVVTILVAGTAVGATVLLTGDSGAADVLAWTPSDSVAYAELRLDLPGSQEAELAKVLSAFPGFDDQAAFPTKLNEALDELVHKATNGKQGYQADILPWFSGQLAVSVGPLPASADTASARALLLAGAKDASKATNWAAGILQQSGATTATQTYSGVTITTVTPPADSSAAGVDATGAYAIVGPVLALGDLASVKAAIDTGGTSGLATNDQFKTASATISGDRLGFVYVDLAAISKGVTSLSSGMGTTLQLPAAFQDLSAPWAVAALRAQDGAFVIDTRQPHVDKAGTATASESTLPSVLPQNTIALIEGHDLGAGLERLKTLAASEPTLADGVKQIDDALAIVGGFQAAVGWMGEAGVAVMPSGDSVTGGILIAPTDRAGAERLLTQLRGFLTLAGGGSGITVKDETYGDATITTVDLGNLGNLMPGQATGGALDGLGSGLGDVKIAYAVTDGAVVLAADPAFVKAVIDARNGPSLATNDRFSTALGKADKSNASLAWLDVAAIRSLIEGQIPAADRTDYEANVKPYLAPLDSVLGTSAPGSDVDRGTFILSVAGR